MDQTGYDNSRRVNILKKVAVRGKWNLFPAVVEANGKLRDKIKVHGQVEVHSEGTYYIEWWEGKQRRRQAIRGRRHILEYARAKAFELQAAKARNKVVSEKLPPHGKTKLDLAISDFLRDVEPPQREPKTYAAYKHCLNSFLKNCSQLYVQDVVRQDLLAFIRFQYENGCGARTAYNRANIVARFLRVNGISSLLHKSDWPAYVEGIAKIYEIDELRALFDICNASDKLRYLFFLLTGERDKEVRFTTWKDIDCRRGTVRVTAKPQLGFKPKNKEEREIPVPTALLEILEEHKSRQTGPNQFNLVFPTSKGCPDKNFESKLKRIAYRGHLNCGTCTSRHGNRCADGPYCGNWFLHKFRNTYATVNLEDNVCSISKLQEWLGHKDLASTMLYLKVFRCKDIRDRLNNSELASIAILATRAGRSNDVKLPRNAC